MHCTHGFESHLRRFMWKCELLVYVKVKGFVSKHRYIAVQSSAWPPRGCVHFCYGKIKLVDNARTKRYKPVLILFSRGQVIRHFVWEWDKYCPNVVLQTKIITVKIQLSILWFFSSSEYFFRNSENAPENQKWYGNLKPSEIAFHAITL